MTKPKAPRGDNNPHDDFYWKDWWSAPDLALCSLAAQGLWIRMLCLMAMSPKKGYLYVGSDPVTPERLATLVSKPLEEVKACWNELLEKGVMSIGGIDKGHPRAFSRRMVGSERDRQSRAKGGRRGGRTSRDNKKGIFASPEGSPGASPEGSPEGSPLPLRPHSPLSPKETPLSPSGDFDAFWSTYPRRVAKQAARAAFERAAKICPPDFLLTAARRFAQHCRHAGTAPDFIPHAATWLNGQRWREHLPPSQGGEADQQSADLEATAPADEERARWQARIAAWKADGSWIERLWGPAPDQPGCNAPSDLIPKGDEP